jgi:hypothetical protein
LERQTLVVKSTPLRLMLITVPLCENDRLVIHDILPGTLTEARA